eukprot:6491423-Amphidinium_carterae.1
MENAEAEEHTGRKKGSGGAWRAFVHSRSRGQKLTPAGMRDLASEYRSLSAEAKQHFCSMGADATFAHKHGEETFPAISRRARHERHLGLGVLAEQAAAAATGQENLARLVSQVLVKSVKLGVELLNVEVQRNKVPPGEIARADHGLGEAAHTLEAGWQCEAIVGTCADYEKGLNAGIASLASDWNQRRRNHAKEVEKLRDALLEYSGARANEVLEHRQRLKDLPMTVWKGLPHRSPLLAHAFTPTGALPDWEGSTKMSDDWQQRHRGVDEESWTVPDPGPKYMARTKCFVHAFCHCKRAHAPLRLLHKRIEQYIKKHAENESVKTELMHARLIMHFHISSRNPQADTRSRGSGDAPVLDDVPPRHDFHLIALQYLSPWRPSLAKLRLVDDRAVELLSRNVEHIRPHDPVQLQVETTDTGGIIVQGLWQYLSGLAFETKHVRMQLLVLSNRLAPCSDLTKVQAFHSQIPDVV